MIWDYILEGLSIIGSLLFVFVALGFCIFSHELGHFLAAKWRGLHIDAFSLGFKPFWRKKINGVEYRLGYLPFGGYVELPQVDATDAIPKAADGTELPRAKALDRMITAFAGPFFNIISGFLIGLIVYWVGMPQDTPKMREIVVHQIDQQGPEYQAGLRQGDTIVKLNGERFFDTWANFVKKMIFAIGEVEFEVLRDGKTQVVRFVPRENPQAPGSLSEEGIAYPFFKPLIPIVMQIEQNSPAAQAGVKNGDILLAVNGQPVQEFMDFQFALDYSDGQPVTLTVKRGKTEQKFVVKPEKIPNLAPEFTRYLTGIMVAQKGDQTAVVVGIHPQGTAFKAGIRPGDQLSKFNGQKLAGMMDFLTKLRANQDRPFQLEVLRQGKVQKFELAARKIVPHTIGVSVTLYDHPTPWNQFVSTLDMSWKSLRGIAIGIGHKLGFTEKQSSLKASHMSGPLGIGTVLFNSVYLSSFISGIYFMVIISFALAIFNLLPFPVLDGGHILFGAIEMIFHKPLPTPIIKGLSTVFVTLLIALMVFVTFADSKRLYRSFFPKSKAVPTAPAPEPAKGVNHENAAPHQPQN